MFSNATPIAEGKNNGSSAAKESPLDKLASYIKKNYDKFFIKKDSHFESKQTLFPVPITDANKKTILLTKLRKRTECIRIENKLNDEKSLKNFAKLNVGLGELYRLFCGPQFAAKYRINIHDEKYYVLSTRVPQFSGAGDLFDYYEQYIFPRSYAKGYSMLAMDWLEGMGRVLFAKYFLLDDDVSDSNILITKDKLFFAIDADRSLFALMKKFKGYFARSKDVAYRPAEGYFSVEAIQTVHCDIDNQWHYVFENKPISFMGEVNMIDYKNFPILRYHLSNIWVFSQPAYEHYSKKLSEYLPLNNEKHFTAFKCLSLEFFGLFLMDVHPDKDEVDSAKKLLNYQKNNFASMLKFEDQFLKYVKNTGINLLKAIISEFNDFFVEDKHYRLPEDDEQKKLWEYLTDTVIQQFKNLYSQLELPEINAESVKELKVFSREIFENKEEAINLMKKFYEDNFMNYMANYISKRLITVKENRPALRI